MFQGEKHNFAWNRIGLIVVLLATSLILAFGVAWGRYRTQLNEGISIRTEETTPIYLFGGKDGERYTELEGHWEISQSGTGSNLSVLITNSVEGEYPQRDVDFFLRLVATEGIGGAENLKLSLYVEAVDGSVAAYDAVAQVILENTQLYEQFGNGWVYQFYDAEGREMVFTLSGGAVSEWSGVLACSEVNLGADPSLLQLQVIARNS